MNRLYAPAIALAVAAIAATPFLADESTARTRDEVIAEYFAAKAAGLDDVGGEIGGLRKDVEPHRYPQPAPSGLTREQVIADMQAARRAGLMMSGELTLVPPVVADATQPALTRAQVEADLAVAQRAGLVMSGELSGPFSW